MNVSAQRVMLQSVLGTYGQTRALKEGIVASERLDLQFTEVEPVTDAFAHMVRRLQYDLTEMAMVTYVLARAHGRPLTALPVVLARSFHHGSIWYNAKSGIRQPADLAGKRVGIRAYAQTTGVWIRGILKNDYGVDLDGVTWVLTEEEHVPEFEPAVKVIRHPHKTKTVQQMLESGEVDAAIGGVAMPGNTDILPLIPDHQRAGEDWFRRTGIYPVNHIVVIKEEVVADHPWVPKELFGLLEASKELYLKRLRQEGPANEEDRRRVEQQTLVGDDPLPHGLEANRKGFEALVQYAYEQHIIPRQYPIEELFVSCD